VAKLQENAQLFLDGARERGLDVGDAIGAAVVTVQFPVHALCMKAAEELLRAGYYAPPITQLAVPKNKPRIRFFLSAAHTPEEIIGALDVMAGVQGAAKPSRVHEAPMSALEA
jgi:7-keto-8-aminopelargonate synthetase-like enzyme